MTDNARIEGLNGGALDPDTRESNKFPDFGKDYQVLALIHDSGMGRVYKTLHVASGKITIVKTLRRHHKESFERSRKRFEREAKALARFDHPNIVGILDYRLDSETPFIALEYIEGLTLRAYIDRFPDGLPLNRFFILLEQLCDAVNLIHDHGIIHRDLKPKNLMVQRTQDGPLLKILDFGLILFDRLANPEGVNGLTLKSELIGAPAYMSPEQCSGQQVTYLSDIYNIGLIAHEMLTGKQVFKGKNLQDIITQQVEKTPVCLSDVRSDIPSFLANAVNRALQKKPNDRFFSTRAFWLAASGEKSK